MEVWRRQVANIGQQVTNAKELGGGWRGRVAEYGLMRGCCLIRPDTTTAAGRVRRLVRWVLGLVGRVLGQYDFWPSVKHFPWPKPALVPSTLAGPRAGYRPLEILWR